MLQNVGWKAYGKRPFGRPRRRREVNNRMNVTEVALGL
jgi:hypothetical protein